jgi:hypothetical protein
MLPVKFFYNGSIRRSQIHTDEIELTYDCLLKTAKTLFAEDVAEKPHIFFSWVDEEKDAITVSSDIELREAVRVMKATSRPFLRFNIEVGMEGNYLSVLTSYFKTTRTFIWVR